MFVNKSFTARSKSPSHRFNAISTHGRGNPILFDRRATGSGGAELFDSCAGSIAVTRDVVVFARLLVLLLSLSTLFVLKSLGFGFDMTASIVMTSDDEEDDEDVVFSSMLLIDPAGGAVGLLFFLLLLLRLLLPV